VTIIRLLGSKELLYLLLCSGGCWYVGLDTLLAVDPFTISKPYMILWMYTLHIFL